MQQHPMSKLFPPLSAQEFSFLVEDLKNRGLLTPITLFEEKVLDGWNRLLACKEAEVEPRFRPYTGADPLGFVLSANLHRRHLSESQRAMLAAKIKAFAPARYVPVPAAKNEAENGGVQICTQETPLANQRLTTKNQKTEEIAGALAVSPRLVKSAQKILREGTPADVAEIEAGTKTVSAAAKGLEKPKDAEIKDKLGKVVPAPIVALWRRSEEASRDLSSKIVSVERTVRAGIKEGNPVFAEVSQTTLASLKRLVTALSVLEPFAVCPTCHGELVEECAACKHRGFVSKFFYDHCVPSDLKK